MVFAHFTLNRLQWVLVAHHDLSYIRWKILWSELHQMKVKNTGDTTWRSLLWTKAIKCCFGLKKMRWQLYPSKVIEWEIHFIIMCMWMTSNLLVVMSIYCRRRKEVLVLKVQKNVLGRVSLVIIIEIHLEKNKRGISNVTWTCLERYLKYACEKPKHVLIDRKSVV